jgi:hypothetical protein
VATILTGQESLDVLYELRRLQKLQMRLDRLRDALRVTARAHEHDEYGDACQDCAALLDGLLSA